jgi:hypothetical protein
MAQTPIGRSRPAFWEPCEFLLPASKKAANMDKPSVQIDAPIVPNEGLGGLKLRSKIADIQDLLMGLGLYKSGSFELVAPFEARYRLGNGEVEVGVDVRNGKIFKLIAGPGYQGQMGGIAVGMRMGDAMKQEPCLRYDEAEESVLLAGCPGVVLDVSEIDPLPESVPALPISAISVYAVEALQGGGQRGDW